MLILTIKYIYILFFTITGREKLSSMPVGGGAAPAAAAAGAGAAAPAEEKKGKFCKKKFFGVKTIYIEPNDVFTIPSFA